MKELLIKFLSVPFAAYFSMMLTVALLGSTMGNAELKELTGGSGLAIWLGWMAIFFITIIAHHFLKKEKEE
jgi:hypothetical protein